MHLWFPGIPALPTPIDRLITPGKSPEEAVATGGCGDGGGTATRAFEGFVFFEQVGRLDSLSRGRFVVSGAFFDGCFAA